MFLSLFKHRHTWAGSAWNPFGFEHEQKCSKCGAYRHQYFTEKLDQGPWIDGEHPKAHRMRQDEKATD